MAWFASSKTAPWPEYAPHHVYKRDTEADEGEKEEGGGIVDKMKKLPTKAKEEFNKDVDFLAEKTHMKPW